MNRRVVITGYSAITPIGQSPAEILDHLDRGVSGVKPLVDDGFWSDFIESRVYGRIDYPVETNFTRSQKKTMGPVAFVACEAARRTFLHAGVPKDFITSGRLGVAFGSIHGSPQAQRQIMQRFYDGPEADPASVGAAEYLKSMAHTTAVNITKMFGITGRVISPCTACTTSSQAIGFGYETIRFGLQDAMLCGGADEYDTSTVAVFDNLRACSCRYNDAPGRTPRPFDLDRDGLVVGEGAGALLLEDLSSARKRSAPIFGEVIGFASNNNGGDLILPDRKGIEETMRLGLEDAGIKARDVDVISAHATATRQGDRTEAAAIHRVYGDRPRVTALKSYMGHTIAACGAIETIITLLMMEHGFVPPTLNLETVEPECAMINHVRNRVSMDVTTAVVQNFAFGGINTSLVLRRPQSER